MSSRKKNSKQKNRKTAQHAKKKADEGKISNIPKMYLSPIEVTQESEKKGYRKEYCQEIIRHGGEGGNFVEFAAKKEINRSTLYEWAKKHPEFKEAMEISKLKNESYWWKRAKDHLGYKFNFGVWKFVMINVFGYKDIKDIDELDAEEQHVIILPEIKCIENLPDKRNESMETADNMDSTDYTDQGSGI